MAAAIGSRKFDSCTNVRRVAIGGPTQGVNSVFTFELLSGDGPQGTSVTETSSLAGQQGSALARPELMVNSERSLKAGSGTLVVQ